MTLKARPVPRALTRNSARAEFHGGDAAPGVGDLAGHEGAHGTAQKCDGDGEPGEGVAQDEVALDGIDGAVDNRGVKAKEEAAHGAGHGKAHDLAGDGLGWRCVECWCWTWFPLVAVIREGTGRVGNKSGIISKPSYSMPANGQCSICRATWP